MVVVQGKSYHTSGHTRGKGSHKGVMNMGLQWPLASFGEVSDDGASLVGIHQVG